MTQIPSVPVDHVPAQLPEGLSVLDVREPVEFEHGHIEGAFHIPLMDLPGRLDELPSGQLLVVCKIGGRSAQAVGYLVQQGIDALNLDGGMVDWADAGRPMVSDSGDPARVV